jgi:hypothetical protein
MSARQKQQPAQGEKYTWIWSPGFGMNCFRSPDADQTVTKLWEVEHLTTFHDAELAQATKEINAILTKLEASNKDPDRTLSFIRFQNRHFLVWARYGAIGPHDDEAMITKALGLKRI